MVSFGKFKKMALDAYNNASEEMREAAFQKAVNAGYLHVDSEGASMEPRSIIILVIGIFILATLLPPAITALNGANTTGWTATELAIWSVVAVIIIAAVIMRVAE